MRRTIGLLAVMAFCLVSARTSRPAMADERGKSGITFEAVLEKIEGETITVRAYHHVIPPAGSSGGAVHSGHLPVGAKATRYERLPVMPDGWVKEKKPRPGARVNVTLDTIKSGALVATRVEERTDAEKIGVDWIDAPKSKH